MGIADFQKNVALKIRERFAESYLLEERHAGQISVHVRGREVGEVLRFLRTDPDAMLDVLSDLCGVDYLNRGMAERFCVVYQLASTRHLHRFRLKAFVPENDPVIESVTSLWPAADWAERETYDMYGISFRGHPALRRILQPDTYEGFALRKDYPLTGTGEREGFPRYKP